MQYYDFTDENEEITLEKLLENYKFLEYITNKKFKENPSMELAEERRTYRKSVKMIERVIKKRNENETMHNTI